MKYWKSDAYIYSYALCGHTHYADELSLKDIVDTGMMSIAQCNRCFNKMLNVTPYEYLIQYRLQKATNLLKDATLNVTEISEIVGFNNVTHFIQVFKITKEISNDGGLR